MPFYEYECAACGHQLEAMQKFSDPPLRKCPSCGKSRLKKLMSAPAFRLVGGGWYETDFKGDKNKQRNLSGESDKPAETAAEKPAEKAPEKAAEKAAEKPAAKPEKTAEKKMVRKKARR